MVLFRLYKTEKRSTGSGSAEKEAVNINTATVDDFKKVTGVGPKKAEKIIAFREQHGDFKDLNEESFKLILDDMKTNADNSIANGIISEIGKEIDIPSSTGEFIGVSKVIKEDLPRFNEILSQLIDEDRQNYYDFAYKPLSRDTTIDYVLTNGLKWTEIDDHNDWKIANNLIDEFEN